MRLKKNDKHGEQVNKNKLKDRAHGMWKNERNETKERNERSETDDKHKQIGF